MNYSDQQIEEGLKNFFIQVEVKTTKGRDLINRIFINLNQEPFKISNEIFIYGYIFENDEFGLNAGYSKKENITVITI
jgi:hypothetical protein